ncbi:MAG TPA: OsmC family protein [Rhodothermales bacterium]|nr:osmotically inducible protein OsmC [Bacteroidota bacterium]HRK74717.1 OsmC family protein [Rhodothermales bacterium]HRR08227.1 OsmC family protein [Rhodothermales bacterium]
MKIEINRLDDAFLLQSVNEAGKTILTDANPEIGGGDQAFRPMQLLLAAAGSCSVIDIILILKKQRQRLDDIKVTIEGHREPLGEANIFRKIHLHYRFWGAVDALKAEKAIQLSMEKYCSVVKTLESTAHITTSFDIIPT